jgi:hypothetical protein
MGGQSERTISSTTTGSAGASGHLLFVLALVIPSPGLWSVIQGWISRPMAQNPCRDRAGERPTERVAPLADTLKALKTC